MKIGAYQFGVTGSIEDNFAAMETGVMGAAERGVRLLAFPECALSGYPPYDVPGADRFDFDKLARYRERLGQLARETKMYLLAGMAAREGGNIYNSAVLFTPDGATDSYRKRALWGWDRDNFTAGDRPGIFWVDGWKVGVRVCFEVRFPEYFRELYRERTDLDVILFYDRTDREDMERYGQIRAHIVTRAVENVTHILTVDTIRPHQSAPTALFGPSGTALAELERNKPGLLVYDLEKTEDDFGERGRREISDELTKGRGI